LEWYSEPGYDVVKEKMRCGVSGIVEGGHSFSPFGKVIKNNNNVFVTIAGGGITGHKVNTPFAKGACSNDRMKKRGGSAGFVGIELTLLTSFHDMNAIMKQSRPKVTSPDNLLRGGDTRKMSPTCTTVAIV
jgi:hypothetical protein